MNRTGFARHGAASVRDAVAVRDAAIKAKHKAAREAHTLAVAAEAARVRLTRDDVVGARHVRDRYGWHRVVRVNVITVTVRSNIGDTPGTETIRIDRILDVSPPR